MTTVGLPSAFGLPAAYAGLYLRPRAVYLHVALLTLVSVSVAGTESPSAALSVLTSVVPVCVVLAFITYRRPRSCASSPSSTH